MIGGERRYIQPLRQREACSVAKGQPCVRGAWLQGCGRQSVTLGKSLHSHLLAHRVEDPVWAEPAAGQDCRDFAEVHGTDCGSMCDRVNNHVRTWFAEQESKQCGCVEDRRHVVSAFRSSRSASAFFVGCL
jgi:hypothetical protein